MLAEQTEEFYNQLIQALHGLLRQQILQALSGIFILFFRTRALLSVIMELSFQLLISGEPGHPRQAEQHKLSGQYIFPTPVPAGSALTGA